jgi:signal transduction histidine kinase
MALEVPDLGGLAALLTRTLPQTLGVAEATLFVWNRRLEVFDVLTPGETLSAARLHAAATPEVRYLISEGRILETREAGEGVLLPLMARSGLVGTLVLGRRRGRRRVPYALREVRLLTVIAQRAALALENHLYQQEIIASERVAALGTMAGMLAHDFRGPMTLIRGYAESLEHEGLPQAEVQARAQQIVKAVDRLHRMTSEMLDFVKGGERLARRPVVLPRLLEDLARDLETDLPGLQVAKAFEMPQTQAQLDVDKVRRAVENIAANARDAMGGQGRLCFRGRLEDGMLVLELADEGPGVPAEIRETLFEPFVTRGKKGGTGLGLAVARRFVEDHGGTVELVEGGPGASFRISLPLAGSA